MTGKGRQPEPLAQRAGFIARIQQTALTQQRYDMGDEIVLLLRKSWWQQHEAVSGATCGPVLDLTGDLLRRSDGLPVAPRAGEPFLAGKVRQQRLAAAD